MAEVWFTLSRNICRLNKKMPALQKPFCAVEEMDMCKMQGMCFCSKKIRPLDEINAAIIMLVINWGGENVGQPTFIGKNEE